MKENGTPKQNKGMAGATKSGPTAVFMKGTGNLIKQMDVGD